MNHKFSLKRIGDGYRANIDGKVVGARDKKEVRQALEHYFGGHTQTNTKCPYCRKHTKTEEKR